MATSFEFWLPWDLFDPASGSTAQSGRRNALAEAARTLHQIEEDQHLYTLELAFATDRGAGVPSLVELCEIALNALRDVPARGHEAGYLGRWLTLIHATQTPAPQAPGLRLIIHKRSERHRPQPAGMLLVDLRHEPEPGNEGAGAEWAASIRDALDQSGLARAGAEFALAVDLPTTPVQAGREGLIDTALTLAERLTTLLPREQRMAPNLVELWLTRTPISSAAASDVRVRIWRLGYMKIPSPTRFG